MEEDETNLEVSVQRHKPNSKADQLTYLLANYKDKEDLLRNVELMKYNITDQTVGIPNLTTSKYCKYTSSSITMKHVEHITYSK